MKKIRLFCGMLIISVVFIGCGKSGSDIDTAPFEKAVAAYLSNKHMDMKVSKFRKITVDGDSAEAECSMKEASGMSAGIAVQWGFTFSKQADGSWKVSQCRQ